MLETLGVDALGARHPSSLSGGQLQRVVVARALIGRPAVVFADEPTGALDSVNAELVLQTLVEGCAQADAAAVVVSHDPAVMNQVDRVIEMRDGSVSS
jgi:putative ABC transport system ATP-binding protein